MNNNSNKKVRFSLPLGTASILLTFLTLSLISFAILSMQSSILDYRLTQKVVSHTKDYYDAFHKAQSFIAITNTKCMHIHNSSKDIDYFYKTLSINKKNPVISKDFEITEFQFLHVELQINYPTDSFSNDFYKVISYKVMTRDELFEYEDLQVPVSNTSQKSK